MNYIAINKYYDTNPTKIHATGDIWSNLPTYGLLKSSHLPSIVITPACDLANDKVETITYLPIIPISSYLVSNGFLPEVRGYLLNLADSVNLKELRDILEFPSTSLTSDLDAIITKITPLQSDKNKGKTIQRILSGLSHYKKSLGNGICQKEDLVSLFSDKIFDKLLHRIITNSYSNDISFLPNDNQDSSWSVIKEHSVVLFRYPFTAPIELFDLAQSMTLDDWQHQLLETHGSLPFVNAFAVIRPVKSLILNTHCLHDLLIRFVSLFSRIGSPDINLATIQKLKSEVL